MEQYHSHFLYFFIVDGSSDPNPTVDKYSQQTLLVDETKTPF